ncbi:hypothetical protein B0H16DRAFT_1719964 [Mycena metata]|uniref:Uncharacterized protein n=1 Tax=Mycena metata TaxID=1033252 RepID=A0AAD7JAK7_9AGAR|nr:hypothetical protein B0H16DRAFT_1719964 [Mycena metata]
MSRPGPLPARLSRRLPRAPHIHPRLPCRRLLQPAPLKAPRRAPSPRSRPKQDIRHRHPPLPQWHRLCPLSPLLKALPQRKPRLVCEHPLRFPPSVSTRSSPQTPSSPAHSLHTPSLAFSIDEHAELDEDDLLEGPPLRDLQKTPLDSLDDFDVPVPPLPGSASFRSTPPRTATPRRESIALNSVAMPITDSDTEPDFDALEDRAGSPDIASILATTPRPRLSSLAHRTSDFDHEPPWEEEFIDDYGQVRGSIYSVASKASERYAFGFPEEPDAQSVSSDNGHPVWDEPNDSDSDLDLHTALPQLMLHHGFLSPRSKLLANTASTSLAPTPSPASTVFGNTDPLPRDTRDTPNRRVRHRDGKLLRGGIGLTTGLGWSDSEDEDAPSALTRRISNLNLHRSRSQLGLSRASSFSILGGSASTRSSTFSHSTSRLPSRRTQSEYAEDTGVDEFGTVARREGPPTSWTRRSEPPSRLSRAQSQTQLTRGASIRTDESAGSAMSLPLMRSHSRVLRVMAADKEKPLPRTPSLRRAPSNALVSGIRPRAATGVNASSLPRPQSRAVSLSMQSTPQPGGPSSASTPAPPLPMSSVPHKPQMRPLRLQPRPAVIGGDRAPVPVPSVPSVLPGLSTSHTASSLASSTSSSSGLSVSTSATSISLLSPSPSMSLLTPSSPIGSPAFPRAPVAV